MNRLMMIEVAVAQESDGPIGSLFARGAEKLGEAVARGPPPEEQVKRSQQGS